MDARWVIVDVVSLGDATLIAHRAQRRRRGRGAQDALRKFWPLAPPSLFAGGVAGAVLALLALAMQALPLRHIFIALSPDQLKALTFGLGAPLGGAA